MISLLVYVLVVALILGLIWYAVTLLPLPEPFKTIALVVIILIFVIYLLSLIGVFHVPPRLP